MIALNKRYRLGLGLAVLLHFTIGIFLALDPSSARPVLIEEAKNEPGENTKFDQDLAKQPEIVQAVSVDAAAVQETVERLKQARLETQQQEQAHQTEMKQALARAEQARVAEQQRLADMKREEEQIAIKRKKALEEEKKHLKALADQKAKEMKALEELKTKQEALKKKQALEKKQLEKKQMADAAAKQKADALKASTR